MKSICVAVVVGVLTIIAINYYVNKQGDEAKRNETINEQNEEKQNGEKDEQKEENEKKYEQEENERKDEQKEEKNSKENEEMKKKKWKKIDDYFNYAQNKEIGKYIENLIEKNEIGINERDPTYSYTLLMWSAFHGVYCLTQLLINLNADIHLKQTENGETALEIAKRCKKYRNYGIIDLLIEHGAVDKNPLTINKLNKFDIASNEYEKFNTVFDGIIINKKQSNLNSRYTSACFASSNGWNEGINEFKMKCVKPGMAAIGITTDIKHCKKLNSWFSKIDNNKEAIYCWLGGQGIYKFFEGHKYEPFSSQNEHFNEGDIIRIIVDCEIWKISFYRNGECYHYNDIVKHRTYFPFVNPQSLGYETCYKLV